jgi:RNA-directed DNA polymerase
VIFQKVFYAAIEDFCEDKFIQIDSEVSFAYRKRKSAPLAIRKIYEAMNEENFLYALDGDIKKFFDEIPHDNLLQKLHRFFGKGNKLTITFLKDKVQNIG